MLDTEIFLGKNKSSEKYRDNLALLVSFASDPSDNHKTLSRR